MRKNIAIFTVLIVAIATRFIPPYANTSAIGAVALLGGSWLGMRHAKFLGAIAILFISDIILNNTIHAASFEGFTLVYSGMGIVYAAHLFMVAYGAWSQTQANTIKYAGHAAVACIGFFLISNIGAWMGNPVYPQNATGLMAAYAAGLPFLATHFVATVGFGYVMQFALTRSTALAKAS